MLPDRGPCTTGPTRPYHPTAHPGPHTITSLVFRARSTIFWPPLRRAAAAAPPSPPLQLQQKKGGGAFSCNPRLQQPTSEFSSRRRFA